MGIFNSGSPPIDRYSKAVIREDYGLVPIDNDYAKLGIDEGWLILENMRTDYTGLFIRTYRTR